MQDELNDTRFDGSSPIADVNRCGRIRERDLPFAGWMNSTGARLECSIRRKFVLRSEFDATNESRCATLMAVREFGQTLLLARRLVEARVPLITINWSKLNCGSMGHSQE